MAFTRGKYGVEHNRRPIDEKSHGLRWLLALLGILLVASFILARLFRQQPPARIDAESRPPAPAVEPPRETVRVTAASPGAPTAPAPRPPVATPQPSPAHVKPEPPDPKATRDAAKLLDSARQRPAAERVLLE